MSDIAKLIEANKIKGYLSIKEGKLLYNLAKKCRGRGAIVEIGSWMGKSTVWIGKGVQQNNLNKIYAVDPHEGVRFADGREKQESTLPQFEQNIKNAGVSELVTPIVKYSADAAKDFQEPIEFIFIDGLHEYENVKLDFDSWFPKVISGGIMAFHDTSEDASGAKRFVEEAVYLSNHFRNVRLRDSITYAEKVNSNSGFDRFKNKCGLYFKRQHENNKLPKWVRKIFKQLMKI